MASYWPSRSLRMRVSTLPRMSWMFRSGRAARSWHWRRRLPVPTLALFGRSWMDLAWGERGWRGGGGVGWGGGGGGRGAGRGGGGGRCLAWRGWGDRGWTGGGGGAGRGGGLRGGGWRP